MASAAKTAKTPPRKDGRRPFMVYLDPGLIKAIKRAALEEDRPAYEFVEEHLRKVTNTVR